MMHRHGSNPNSNNDKHYICMFVCGEDFVILMCRHNTLSTCKFELSLLQTCLQVCQPQQWSLER